METKTMIEEIVKELVDIPENVVVEEVKTNSMVVINITVEKTDIGKIIGKKGRIIGALRTLFGSIFAKDGIKAHIEVND